MKLCELHVHLEGCVFPLLFREFWKRSEFLFPPPKFEYAKPFDKFLAHLRFGYSFLNRPEAYAAVMREYARKAESQHIRYAEFQINLALLRTWGLNLAEVLEEMQSELSQQERPLTARFIVDLPWQFNPDSFQAVLDDIDRLKQLGLRGVSMGGDEVLAFPLGVKPAFDRMREAGLGTLCHAGETTDPGLALEIVQELNPNRIAHAITIADWVEEMGPEAPGIDVCLTSNFLLKVIKSYGSHPLGRWIEAGVSISLSTDDPAIFDTDLESEYRIAQRHFPNFGTDQSSLDASWVDLALDKEAVLAALSEEPGESIGTK